MTRAAVVVYRGNRQKIPDSASTDPARFSLFSRCSGLIRLKGNTNNRKQRPRAIIVMEEDLEK
jgi:hypothetical protein